MRSREIRAINKDRKKMRNKLRYTQQESANVNSNSRARFLDVGTKYLTPTTSRRKWFNLAHGFWGFST